VSIRVGCEYVGHIDPWTDEERLSDEEIVRCGDCRWFKPDGSDHEHRSGWWCKWWGTDLARPDKFCSWGIRREDA
jgi:hypothetical protein